MATYESSSYVIEAVQYNGTNMYEIKDILLRQKPPGRVTVTGFKMPFIRQPNRPDQPLIRGDWIFLDYSEFRAHHMMDELFTQSFKR